VHFAENHFPVGSVGQEALRRLEEVTQVCFPKVTQALCS